MEGLLKEIAANVALVCELIAVLFVALGAAEALGRVVMSFSNYDDLQLKKEIWLRFAAMIVLALEFALAADIARTAIAPTWKDIGQLAAIATIRTLLNLFLERDLDSFRLLGAKREPKLEA